MSALDQIARLRVGMRRAIRWRWSACWLGVHRWRGSEPYLGRRDAYRDPYQHAWVFQAMRCSQCGKVAIHEVGPARLNMMAGQEAADAAVVDRVD